MYGRKENVTRIEKCYIDRYNNWIMYWKTCGLRLEFCDPRFWMGVSFSLGFFNLSGLMADFLALYFNGK